MNESLRAVVELLENGPALGFLPIIIVYSTDTKPIVVKDHKDCLKRSKELEGIPSLSTLLYALYNDDASNANGIVESVIHYDAWLNEADDRFVCAVYQPGDGQVPFMVVCPSGGTLPVIAKTDFLQRLTEGRKPLLNGALFSTARFLYRADQALEAHAMLDAALEGRRGGSAVFLLHQAIAVLDATVAGRPVPPHLSDVLGHSDYFSNLFCSIPFYEASVGIDGDLYICCPSYLNVPVGNIRSGKFDEIVNSDIARKIRGSILDGSFRYCNRVHCSLMSGNNLPTKEVVRIDPYFDKIIDENRVTQEKIHRFSLALDKTCNLSCPSCRSELIIEKGDVLDWKMQATQDVILPILQKVETLMMTGYGEFAMSAPCRLILEKVNPEQFPDLKFDLITNGLLFDRAFWQRYPNIHTMIRQIRVSIDGATKETYEKLRRGGTFEHLQRNMEFLADLHRDGFVPTLAVMFVYQLDNFREMKRMAEWTLALGCDRIHFEKLLDWSSFGSSDEYLARAVHHPSHPCYTEFRSIVDDPIFINPAIRHDWLDCNVDAMPSSHKAFFPLFISGLDEGGTLSFGNLAHVFKGAARLAAMPGPQVAGLATLVQAITTEMVRRPTSSYDAARLFEQWLNAEGDTVRYGVVVENDAVLHFTAECGGAEVGTAPTAKARWLVQLVAHQQHTYLHGGLFAATRGLFLAGAVQEAHDALFAQSQREHHFLNVPALKVAQLTLAREVVPAHLSGVFGAEQPCRQRFCPRPFGEVAIERGGQLFVCHSHYLNLSIGTLEAPGLAAALQSKVAVAIRESILEGQFT